MYRAKADLNTLSLSDYGTRSPKMNMVGVDETTTIKDKGIHLTAKKGYGGHTLKIEMG